jgi:hypothetical protein
MTILGTLVGILISLALLYWLASLAQEYFSNPAERARLNSKPGDLLFVIFAAVFMIMGIVGICIEPFGNLPIPIGDHQFRVWAVGLVGMVAVLAIRFLSGRNPFA